MEHDRKTEIAMRRPRHLTIVIKIGTSSIVDEKTHQPILSILSLIVETALKLRSDGHRVVIVSSGAIGVGLKRMNMAHKPKHLPQVQALAAVGQCRLMSLWDSLFAHVSQPVAQILLTRNDIADRTQFINAKNTLSELLSMGVIPIVNENDTLAVSEIKFGDNDTLSAITAGMIHADYLFLMTDVDCLYDRNPRKFPDAQPIEVVEDIDALQADVSSAGSSLGTGGMATKIVAARLATSAGTTTIITKSSKPNNVSEIIRYLHPPTPSIGNQSKKILLNGNLLEPSTNPSSTPPLHTRFLPSSSPIRNRAFWILHTLAPHGTIYIDRGATAALSNKAGLLPVGVVAVEGHFAQQEAVRLVVVDRQTLPVMGSLSPAPAEDTIDHQHHLYGGSGSGSGNESSNATDAHPSIGARNKSSSRPSSMQFFTKGEEVGRAVVNYSSAEVARIKGLQSSEIQAALGYADSEYVALRENVSLFSLDGRSRPQTPRQEGSRTPEKISIGVSVGVGVGVGVPDTVLALRDEK